MDPIEEIIKDAIEEYHAINPTEIDQLSEAPSALEFMRYVARNQPFVVRRGASDWKCVREWNADYLRDKMGDQLVDVAITPNGRADSVQIVENEQCFVKPCTRKERFGDVLERISAQELGHGPEDGQTRYAQSQNDNLRGEYETIFCDAPKSVPFARIALQSEPDAINFWLGSSASVTSLHRDPYENIYVQILGVKHFTLLPPVETPCVNEKFLKEATYTFVSLSLEPKFDEPRAHVPFPTWDPDEPSKNTSRFSKLSQPTRVTLHPGDMLYLPAFWYHKVSQNCNEDGICCAINYWYDTDFQAPAYTLSAMARKLGMSALQNPGKSD